MIAYYFLTCFLLAGEIRSYYYQFGGHSRYVLKMGVRDFIKSVIPWRRKGYSVRSDQDLKKGIAKFYDESSSIWIDVWGEDMHHGNLL